MLLLNYPDLWRLEQVKQDFELFLKQLWRRSGKTSTVSDESKQPQKASFFLCVCVWMRRVRSLAEAVRRSGARLHTQPAFEKLVLPKHDMKPGKHTQWTWRRSEPLYAPHCSARVELLSSKATSGESSAWRSSPEKFKNKKVRNRRKKRRIYTRKTGQPPAGWRSTPRWFPGCVERERRRKRRRE